jgi:hypothetical protein
MNVLVPVPVERLPAVLEIIGFEPAEAVLDDELKSRGAAHAKALDLTQPAGVPDMAGEVLTYVWANCTEDAYAVMTTIAESYPTRISRSAIEHATGVNVGGANLSIASHLQRYGLRIGHFLGLKVINGESTYLMTREVAEAVLELAGREAA